MKSILFVLFFFLLSFPLKAQEPDYFINSKEGRKLMNKGFVITQCLKAMGKDRTDKTALAICECQVNKIDGRFTNKQIRENTYGFRIDLDRLIKKDPQLNNEMQDCYSASGVSFLLQATNAPSDFMNACMKNMLKTTNKKYDTSVLKKFCLCQMEIVKSRKMNDSAFITFSDPNSLSYYELLYKCGDPFFNKDSVSKNWNTSSYLDIKGPEADTLSVLNFHGMTFVKARLGSDLKIWLFDTGASDLLITAEMEQQLRNEKLLDDSLFLGIEEYEMANGTIEVCKKYKLNQFQIGKFTIDNIVVAVTQKGKRIIMGKTVLNKFSSWIFNNQNNTIILKK
jgi:hypothetical protein